MTGHSNLQNFTFSILKVDNNGFQELFIDFLTLYLFYFGGGGGGGWFKDKNYFVIFIDRHGIL